LVEGPAISDLFSRFAGSAKAKLLIHGSPSVSSVSLVDRLRSLNFEHVSPTDLISQEISRRTPFGLTAERKIRNGQTIAESDLLSLMRRWFWTRKPDAGFALTGFPATLLQAKVFDEWLDARDEKLNGVFVFGNSLYSTLVDHYRTLGLLIQTEETTSR